MELKLINHLSLFDHETHAIILFVARQKTRVKSSVSSVVLSHISM